MSICTDTEIAYLIWMSEQHIVTSKYNFLRSCITLVKKYHVIYIDDEDRPFKITRKNYNVYVKCSGIIVDPFYISLIHAGMTSLGIYLEDMDPEYLPCQLPGKNNIYLIYQKI